MFDNDNLYLCCSQFSQSYLLRFSFSAVVEAFLTSVCHRFVWTLTVVHSAGMVYMVKCKQSIQVVPRWPTRTPRNEDYSSTEKILHSRWHCSFTFIISTSGCQDPWCSLKVWWQIQPECGNVIFPPRRYTLARADFPCLSGPYYPHALRCGENRFYPGELSIQWRPPVLPSFLHAKPNPSKPPAENRVPSKRHQKSVPADIMCFLWTV